MARLPRLCLPGLPHLLIQRGHNQQGVFSDDVDSRAYLDALRESAATLRVPVHGYALEREQVWLLVTPPGPDELARLLQAVGRRYVAGYNRRHARSGTLWDGRYRSTVVEPGAPLLGALRALEQAPVRAGLAGEAAAWPWSSAAHHAGRRRDSLLSVHPAYWALGNTPFERELAWLRLLEEPLAPVELSALSHAALQGWAWGSGAFIAKLRTLTERPLTPRPRGRPRRAPGSGEGATSGTKSGHHST